MRLAAARARFAAEGLAARFPGGRAQVRRSRPSTAVGIDDVATGSAKTSPISATNTAAHTGPTPALRLDRDAVVLHPGQASRRR